MNAKLEPTNPKNIEFTLTVTMTLEQWQEVKSALERQEHSFVGPCGCLTSAIQDMVLKAREYWWKVEGVDLG